ncbi:uncharacterized protein LOC128965256 [Oppia nitens]|uniref:uncharacterized protein LOC128965256 n=1 Tax=Oppia nitens TaxID=1686743 RepID=UPI0023DB3903|nr:uncharacterized protein LOC128965256 [Oppia nitens]
MLLIVIHLGVNQCETDEDYKKFDEMLSKQNIEKFGKGDCTGSRHKCPLGPWCCDDFGNARNCLHSPCGGVCCPENWTCGTKQFGLDDLNIQNQGYYCKNDAETNGDQFDDQGGQFGYLGGQGGDQGGQGVDQGGQEGGQVEK